MCCQYRRNGAHRQGGELLCMVMPSGYPVEGGDAESLYCETDHAHPIRSRIDGSHLHPGPDLGAS